MVVSADEQMLHLAGAIQRRCCVDALLEVKVGIAVARVVLEVPEPEPLHSLEWKQWNGRRVRAGALADALGHEHQPDQDKNERSQRQEAPATIQTKPR